MLQDTIAPQEVLQRLRTNEQAHIHQIQDFTHLRNALLDQQANIDLLELSLQQACALQDTGVQLAPAQQLKTHAQLGLIHLPPGSKRLMNALFVRSAIFEQVLQ